MLQLQIKKYNIRFTLMFANTVSSIFMSNMKQIVIASFEMNKCHILLTIVSIRKNTTFNFSVSLELAHLSTAYPNEV